MREEPFFWIFFERNSTVNSKRYIASLNKLRDAVRRKRREKNLYVINEHHDSASPHMSEATNNALYKWRVIGPIVLILHHQAFTSLIHLKMSVMVPDSVLQEKWKMLIGHKVLHKLFKSSFQKWVQRLCKCVECNGDYFESLHSVRKAQCTCVYNFTYQHLLVNKL